MRCAFCGEGDRWIKTCCSKDGSRLRISDPCFKVLRLWLTIVPGDGVVTVRYDLFGAYFNPREIANATPGDRYNTYSGACEACVTEGAKTLREVPL